MRWRCQKRLLQRLLGDKIGDPCWPCSTPRRRPVVADLRSRRRAEHAAWLSLLVRAERDDQADEVEEQLFRFGRILDERPQLTTLLSDFVKPAQGRVELVRTVMSQGNGANLTPPPLLAQTVDLLRGERADEAVQGLAQLAVARRGEIVAQVSAATELSDAQRNRLTQVLTRIYNHPVSVQLNIDPAVLGGLAVAVGDEVIDGTLSSRLAAAETKLPDQPGRTAQNHPRPNKGRKTKAMAELTISADDIQGAIQDYVSSFEADTGREEIGTVIDAGDGIAHVEGLPSVMTQELLEFAGGVLGVALNLDEHSVGAVILGEFDKIEEGQQVKRTGEVLGAGGRRVPGPRCQPARPAHRRPRRHQRRHLSRPRTAGPSVVQRQSVSEPLQTGIKAIDAMTPIGRGQRQLIIGDRKTGKTAVCGHHPQPAQELGDRRSDPAGALRLRRRRPEGHHDRQRAPRAGRGWRDGLHHHRRGPGPRTPRASKWFAPYTGSAIAQHWMYDGKHVLIVFDDLTKQAEAYRAISLLLRRPPGREAYPGDVFYLHSRLLERCAKLSDELGGGSLTGLPIIETKANDISAYIPTNVISITDGQCFLETDLFNQGVRPAINVGVSVSRVGGAAQIKAMKEVAGSLRLDLSQYRELEAFAAFASDLDETSKAQLERGARLVELLWQPQYSPLAVEDQVVAIFPAPRVTWTRCRSRTCSASRRSSSSTSRPPTVICSRRSGAPRSSPRRPRTSWPRSSTTSRRVRHHRRQLGGSRRPRRSDGRGRCREGIRPGPQARPEEEVDRRV